MHAPEPLGHDFECKQAACQLLVQRLEDPRDSQQLERAAYLLLYAVRLDSEATKWQHTHLYPTLLQLLRAGSQQHGHQVVTVILEVVATIARQDVCGCGMLLDLGIVTRLADALDSGVTSLATRHAIEALHALATHLPTSRDLILATGAVAKLVALLRDSCAQAHYSMLKGVIWTLICLADDDPLCQAAARTAGALQLLVPVMGLASFDPDIDAFMGLSALAARALRLLGDSTSSSTADQLCCQSPLAQSSIGTQATPLLSASTVDSVEQADWALAAVPCLAKMLSTVGKGRARQPLMRSLSSSSQKLRTMRSQVAHILGAWVFAQALLDVYGYTNSSAPGSPHHRLPTPNSAGSKQEDKSWENKTQEDRKQENKGDVAAGCPVEDDMLVDTGFFAHSTFSKEAKTAAHEVLVRVLETGPSSLEPVKEAVGALRALAAGRVQVTAAAADAGVVKMLVKLLQEDYSSRVAHEASELLTLLTGENEEQVAISSDTEILNCMLDLIKTLLQASNALSGADVHIRSKAGAADSASAELLMSRLSNLKVNTPSAGTAPPSGTPLASLEKPRVSWSAVTVEAKPGLPAILTLPNGECAEVSVPQSPLAGAESGLSHTSSAADRNQLTDLGSSQTSRDAGRVASMAFPHGPVVGSEEPRAHSGPTRSVSNRFGNLLKKLGSINLRNSSSTADAEQTQSAVDSLGLPVPSWAPGAPSPASSSCTPFSVALAQSQSFKSDMLQPGTAIKPAYQPRHPSQAILRAVAMAMANLLSSDLAAQQTKLDAVSASHDVLVLAGRVGLQGGLAKAGAHLVKSLANGNPAAQAAFGEAGSVHQLLSLLLDTASTAAEPQDANSTAVQLVWALHATVDGHKANQLALQTVGGLPMLVSLLAQASTDSTTQILPPTPSQTSSDPAANPPPAFHHGNNAQPDLEGTHGDSAATYSQTADQSQLATALVWLIGSAAAHVPTNQLALHQAGAVYWLLHQIQWSQAPAAVTGAMWALASLAKDHAEVQAEVQLQGGLHLLVSLLSSEAVQQEAALWALQSVIAQHPSNQAAAVQAGALPKLVGLLETGPDTAIAEYAADCVCFLAQGSLQNQDAACSAGAMLPLLDIIAAGPDQLAAKSAALAILALATNHTANQDAFRRAEGLQPLVALLRGGCKSQAAICAAGAIATLVSHNGINQDAVADEGGIEALTQLLSAALEIFPEGVQEATQAEYRAAIESAKALSAMVDGNLPNQDRAVQAGAPQLLCHMASSAPCSPSETGCHAELAWQACKALCCLADDHPAAQQACASAIQPVISFLSSPDAAVRHQACQALACLTCDCHQNQTVAGEHGALKSLLQMLWEPCESAQQQQEVVQLLMAMLVLAVQPGTLTNDIPESGGDAREMSAAVQLSPKQKSALVCKFVPGLPEQHVASALFALLHQEVLSCKETACLLQKQMGEWHLDDWDLTAIKASLQAGGVTCSSDCLSCVGIPL